MTPLKYLLGLVSISFLLISCVSSGGNHPHYLFEIEYFSLDWGYQLDGYFIDSEGKLFYYDRSDQSLEWPFISEANFKEEWLVEKYSSNQEFLGQVDRDELATMYSMVERIDESQLTDPEGRCYDAGALTYIAYRFDFVRGKYHPIILYRAGNFAQENRSEETQVLFEWLTELVGWRTEDINCGPKT